ncbi:MAG: DinB family protein [Terriglobales bacterium]
MKKRYGVASLLAMMFAVCSLCAAQAKAPKTVTSILDSGVKGVEGEFVPAAEAMPEDKYGFAPTNGEFKGVRTFAQQVKHVAAVNYMLASAILEEKPPIELGGENGPDNIKSKAEIVKFIKDSYAYAHKAVTTVTAENAAGEVNSPFGSGKTSRMGMAILITAHSFDHYGQMVEYLRMNGIVPPASRGQ